MGDRKFYPLGMSCTHCGGQLSAATSQAYRSYSIKGLRDLDYIHTDTGERECWRKGEARPFDGWRATEAFEKAQRKAWDEEDAAIEAAEQTT